MAAKQVRGWLGPRFALESAGEPARCNGKNSIQTVNIEGIGIKPTAFRFRHNIIVSLKLNPLFACR
jgi:hypothetical protein